MELIIFLIIMSAVGSFVKAAKKKQDAQSGKPTPQTPSAPRSAGRPVSTGNWRMLTDATIKPRPLPQPMNQMQPTPYSTEGTAQEGGSLGNGSLEGGYQMSGSLGRGSQMSGSLGGSSMEGVDPCHDDALYATMLKGETNKPMPVQASAAVVPGLNLRFDGEEMVKAVIASEILHRRGRGWTGR